MQYKAHRIISLRSLLCLQTKVSWTAGYIVPTVAFGLALAIFLAGSALYVYVPPGGSAFKRIGEVGLPPTPDALLACTPCMHPLHAPCYRQSCNSTRGHGDSAAILTSRIAHGAGPPCII